jgi:hypothetical protein
MIKRIAATSLALGLLAGAALAQSTPPQPTETAPAQATSPQPTAPAATPAAPAAPESAAAPQSADECMKSAADLAQATEDKKIADAKLDKIDDLLSRMEVYCDAKQFSEAMAVAKDIKSLIQTQ